MLFLPQTTTQSQSKLPHEHITTNQLCSSFLVTFLPETANQKLPDTLAEGEALGKGDTLYSHIKNSCGKKNAAS